MPLAVSMRNWCASMNQRSTFLTLANTEPMDATRRVQTGAFTTCASIGSNHRSSPPCRALYEADCQWGGRLPRPGYSADVRFEANDGARKALAPLISAPACNRHPTRRGRATEVNCRGADSKPALRFHGPRWVGLRPDDLCTMGEI